MTLTIDIPESLRDALAQYVERRRLVAPEHAFGILDALLEFAALGLRHHLAQESAPIGPAIRPDPGPGSTVRGRRSPSGKYPRQNP